MRTSRVVGCASVAAALFVLAAVLYEPANLVAVFGLQGRLDEGAVALLSLLVAASLGVFGVLSLGTSLRSS